MRNNGMLGPLLLLGASLLAACGGSPTGATPAAGPTPTPPPADPILAAAGDIACDATTPPGVFCKQMETSDLLVDMKPWVVLALGDLQYESGQYADFLKYYDVSWGRLKPLTRPALGNHEYQAWLDARGYFDYWNGVGSSDGVAGQRGQGWYSLNVGTWHLVALNSNCGRVGCGAGSAQERWLRADLQANTNRCTLAYWHHPRFSSGVNGSAPQMQPLWQALQDGGADVVLAGHDHDYERFAPLNADGTLDPTRGLREFVVGTGGRSLTRFLNPLNGSEARLNESFGVLRMTLHPEGYEWGFVAISGQALLDRGADACH